MSTSVGQQPGIVIKLGGTSISQEVHSSLAPPSPPQPALAGSQHAVAAPIGGIGMQFCSRIPQVSVIMQSETFEHDS
jgi:hypothetical protein